MGEDKVSGLIYLSYEYLQISENREDSGIVFKAKMSPVDFEKRNI